MHPIIARGDRLALYLVVCLCLGGLLAVALSRPEGLGLFQAAAILLPLAVVYGFVCLSSWYVCRATPLRTSGATTLVTNIVGSALVAGGSWLVLGRAIAWIVARIPGFSGADTRFAASSLLLFVVGVLMYLLAIAVHYVLRGVDEARAVEQRALEVQLLAREAELKALRAQIEPHFLFNSLNSISALTTADPQGARRMCILLGEFLRETLSVGARERIPLASEIALATRFFEIEQVRFGARLRVEKSVKEEVGVVQVPPLLLQPLAENAVNHGIAHLLDGGTIRLGATRAGDTVRIVMENPVDPDRPARRSRGLGLDNVRRRLATHYGNQASVAAEAVDGQFRVTIVVPVVTG